jgi:hypothetical protein
MPVRAAQSLTDAELLAYSGEHLYYELFMVWYGRTMIALDPRSADPMEVAHRNARVESYAIHLGNLAHFLYFKEYDAADVLAVHFCDSPQDWLSARPPVTGAITDIRRRAASEVTRLTTSRIAGSPKEKEWDPALANHIVEAMKVFAVRASPKKLNSNIRSLLGV